MKPTSNIIKPPQGTEADGVLLVVRSNVSECVLYFELSAVLKAEI